MNPVIYQNPEKDLTGGSFWDGLAQVPQTIESHIPTFDRSLDGYFDRRFAAIIEEWDLVTESDLHRLEKRLERVSDDISGLYAGKMAIEARAKDLDTLITSLEKSL
ncbi:MAG TPA: hypothetical protein VHN82_09080 [Methanoregula sp.]|nr:hypothetical protein [Methanoregula sp.]